MWAPGIPHAQPSAESAGRRNAEGGTIVKDRLSGMEWDGMKWFGVIEDKEARLMRRWEKQ
jgi:hypothetical protein